MLQDAIKNNIDFVITTGGTGISPRDITVESVKSLIDKEIPGIMEMIRVKYGADKPNALLSRGVAGLTGNTFVYTLPGSVKGVSEYMTEILKTNDHLVYMLNGLDAH
jgi:molybdopterin adenylyltransferase